MKDELLDKWNGRYKSEAYAYGIAPNNYLKEQLEKLPKGKILFPADGEGRNSVFAARLGWTVSAFDISEEGRKKALRLAEDNKVNVDYQLGEFQDLMYAADEFDAIALIYAHFHPHVKSTYHRKLVHYLKKGGLIIFEAFSKKHLDYVKGNEKVGGPRDLGTLFSIEEIRSDFEGFNFRELKETEIELNEGNYHVGIGSVIRFVAEKC